MYLKTLYLRFFRSYREMEISFSPRMNLLIGPNGQGKTNLLEAIFLLSTGKSFRTQNLAPLIQEGQSFFYLEGIIEKEGILQTLKLYFDKTSKKLEINGSSFTSFTPLLGVLPSIFSTPDDLFFIEGSPLERRRLFNLHLAQSNPLYIYHFQRYTKAMKQRNALLRSQRFEAISCWEEEMARSGLYIEQMRENLLSALEKPLFEESSQLSCFQETGKLKLQTNVPKDLDAYKALLEKGREKERDLRQTLTGPHRDEILLFLGEKMAKLFGSEGQKKSALTALRLAEWRLLKESLEETPLFAIDDFGRPLDEKRQKTLFEKMETMGQVFLTSPASLPTPKEGKTIEITRN